MATHVDDSVGRIVRELKVRGLFDSTVIAFAGDNGGAPPVGGFNYPLRGQKTGMHDGGIKTIALISGAGVSGGDLNTDDLRLYESTFHVVVSKRRGRERGEGRGESGGNCRP